MRVGILVHALSGGGGEAVARSWAEQLAASGHEVTFLVYGPGAATGDGAVGVPVIGFPRRSAAGRWLRLPRWVRAQATALRLDVVLSVLDFSNITALRALRRSRGTAVVLSEHSVPTLHWRHDGTSGRVKRLLARRLYRSADGVVTVSHAVATDLRTGYRVPVERLSVLPNPVPAVDAPPQPRSPSTAPGQLRRVVAVGRLADVKRFDRVLDVVLELRRRGIDCTAALLGEGPERSRLERRAADLGVPTELLGWQSPWLAHVREGDCLLVTSDVEGLGNVLVEAAAVGMPAVAPSSALGVADAVVPGVTGVLAASTAVDVLADAVLEAVGLPAGPEEQIRPWLQRFSPAEVGRRLELALSRAVSRTGREPVTHVGPAPDDQGGMAAVLRAYRSEPPGQRTLRFLGSFRPDSPLWSAGPFLRAAVWLSLNRAEHIGIVHTHVSFGGSFLREGALSALARARRRPVVTTVHGSDFLEFLEAHPRLAVRVLGFAHRVVVLSADVRARLPEDLASRTVVLRNPVPVPASPPTPAGDNAPVAVFAGELDRRKGVDVLADSWPRVAARVTGARLVLAGPPGMAEPVTPAASPGVECVGPVPPEGVRRLLRSARLAVLPSRREGMPVFLLEAMAAGRPVVSTTVGAIPETVSGAGLLVEPGDADGLADALVALLADPDRATELGRVGHRMAARFSPAAVNEDLERVYAEACVAAGSGRMR